MASWADEPRRLSGTWFAFRQAAPETAPLFHSAGERIPSQFSGRWHRETEGYAQYLALEALGAWAELVRYERIRARPQADSHRRRLWHVYIEEHDVADLSTFGDYTDCGLDPRLAVGPHGASQQVADELRAAGFRGVLSPSAALPGVTNLTLFGERYEKILTERASTWPNPQPEVRLACNLVAEGPPPADLVTATCFVGQVHDGYRDYLSANGLAAPTGPP